MVNVVFIIERGAIEISLLGLPYAMWQTSLINSYFPDLRTVQNRNPAVMADRSELACQSWLAEELVWGTEVVTVEPSNPVNPA